jgi:hypothetical protein
MVTDTVEAGSVPVVAEDGRWRQVRNVNAPAAKKQPTKDNR